MFIKLLEKTKDHDGTLLPRDSTVGRVYEIEGFDYDREVYYIDDVGDRSYALTEGGSGVWEVVK